MSEPRKSASALPRDLAAGAALGVLVGLLVGMTTSSIVGSVIGSLIALVTAFVGLGGQGQALFGAANAARIIAFSIAAVAALLAGVVLRTHEVLSPPTAAMMAELTGAGFTEEEAKDLVRFRRFGLVPSGAAVSADNPVVRGATSSLFSGEGAACNSLRRDRALGAEARIARLEGYGGGFAEAAERIRRLPQERQADILDAAEFYLCGT